MRSHSFQLTAKRHMLMGALCHTAGPLFVPALFVVSIGFSQDRSRDAWQQPVAIMDSIGIHEGMTIGEAGAGTGYFTFHLARRVGVAGKVIANDIDRESLEHIKERMRRDSVTNIVTLVGDVDDPCFPEESLDMVVIMNAFHDFTEPTTWMKNVVPSMKRGAALVIIDRDPQKLRSGWNHFKTREQILEIMAKTDFTLIRVLSFLERDNIYIFALASSSSP
jgi:ubiquinone/menaquinone biosynthesis C-methylase UbiE